MSTKIRKSQGATPDEFELSVAEEILRLETSSSDLTAALKDLYITAAKEVPTSGSGRAIIIYVPYKLLKSFRGIQQRLVRELEKKFSGAHVLIIAQRTILGKNYSRSSKTSGIRPRSRTLTAVQDAILEDILYPTEITGKRIRCKVDGSRVLKVHLDSKDQVNVEPRLATYAMLLFSQFSELKAFLPSPTTIRRLNSSARFYSSPEESASIRFEDIKFNIQEETTRAIKQLEEQNNAEIQALKHKLAATTGDAPIELEKNHVVSNSERSIKADLSSEECAQALTHFMTKSHEEKLSALKHLKENKDSVIKALKQQLQKKKDEERSLEHAAQEYSETITDMSRKIESAQKFISTYVVKKQEEKRRAIADAERVIAKKYEQKLKAFLLDPAPPGPDPTEASCDANRLFKRRNAKIVAAATVGKTRWGDMEVKKVIHVTTTSTTTTTSETAQKDDPNTTSLTLFDKKNSFSNSVVSKKVLMNDAMLLYCSAMHIRLKRVV